MCIRDRLVAPLDPAVAIGHRHPQQVENFREGAAGEARIRHQSEPDLVAQALGQLVGERLGGEDKERQIDLLLRLRQDRGDEGEAVAGVAAPMGGKEHMDRGVANAQAVGSPLALGEAKATVASPAWAVAPYLLEVL